MLLRHAGYQRPGTDQFVILYLREICTVWLIGSAPDGYGNGPGFK